jgi:hypothetical protein
LYFQLPTDPDPFNQAIAYLQQDPGMAQIIQQLSQSLLPTVVEYVHDGISGYDPDSNTVYWDPCHAVRTRGGGRQTPALQLGHELAHAAAPDPWQQFIDFLTPVAYYTNAEEWRVVSGPETDAAITLGESVRTDHHGTSYPVPTPVSE